MIDKIKRKSYDKEHNENFALMLSDYDYKI